MIEVPTYVQMYRLSPRRVRHLQQLRSVSEAVLHSDMAEVEAMNHEFQTLLAKRGENTERPGIAALDEGRKILLFPDRP